MVDRSLFKATRGSLDSGFSETGVDDRIPPGLARRDGVGRLALLQRPLPDTDARGVGHQPVAPGVGERAVGIGPDVRACHQRHGETPIAGGGGLQGVLGAARGRPVGPRMNRFGPAGKQAVRREPPTIGRTNPDSPASTANRCTTRPQVPPAPPPPPSTNRHMCTLPR